MDSILVDRIRKRKLFYLCIAIGIPITIIFAFIDYFDGKLGQISVDLIFTAVLISTLLGIRKFNIDGHIYRTAIFLLGIVFLYAAAIGIADGTVLYWFFVFPVLVFFFLGKFEGLIWSLLLGGALAILLFVPLPITVYDYPPFTSSRFISAFLYEVLVAHGLESSRYRYSEMVVQEKKKLLVEKKQLEEALREIKTLSGMLPICANCKKIRDDEGYWHDVAVYIRDHSDANFSHGICPDCIEELYPQISKKNKSDEK